MIMESMIDADFAIWDGHPLDSRSKTLITIINGKTVFKDL